MKGADRVEILEIHPGRFEMTDAGYNRTLKHLQDISTRVAKQRIRNPNCTQVYAKTGKLWFLKLTSVGSKLQVLADYKN